MFLLVPAYPGSPGQKAVKRLCVCVCVSVLLPAYPGSPGQKAVKRLCVCVCVCVRTAARPALSSKREQCHVVITYYSESFTHKMAAKTSLHRYETELRHCRPMYLSVLCQCWLGSRVVSVLDSGAEAPGVQIAVATLSGNSLRQTVHTHCASVHQAAKLVAAPLRVAGVTADLAESNGSLQPGS